MKRPLGNRPLRKARVPAGIEIRTFRPGTADELDWLTTNAEAFADHPEQGRLTAEDLAERMAEPWFDPEGFFVAYRGTPWSASTGPSSMVSSRRGLRARRDPPGSG